MTEALEALERVKKALRAGALHLGHNQLASAENRIAQALSLLPTLRAALSAEGVGDAEIEAIRGRANNPQSGYLGMSPRERRMYTDRATLLRKVDEQAARERKDYQYARNLLLSLYRKHFPEGKGIEPLDDLSGVLTQIDNLTTAQTRAAKET